MGRDVGVTVYNRHYVIRFSSREQVKDMKNIGQGGGELTLPSST